MCFWMRSDRQFRAGAVQLGFVLYGGRILALRLGCELLSPQFVLSLTLFKEGAVSVGVGSIECAVVAPAFGIFDDIGVGSLHGFGGIRVFAHRPHLAFVGFREDCGFHGSMRRMRHRATAIWRTRSSSARVLGAPSVDSALQEGVVFLLRFAREDDGATGESMPGGICVERAFPSRETGPLDRAPFWRDAFCCATVDISGVFSFLDTVSYAMSRISA